MGAANIHRGVEDPTDPDKIKTIVFQYYNLSEDIFDKKRKTNTIAYQRYVLVYFLWHYTQLTQLSIGKFINRDRTIVPSAVKVVNNMCRFYKEKKDEIINLEQKIQQC